MIANFFRFSVTRLNFSSTIPWRCQITTSIIINRVISVILGTVIEIECSYGSKNLTVEK